MDSNKEEVLSSVLDMKDFISESDGFPVSGICLIQNYAPCPQKNGGRFMAGQMQVKGSVQFKAWGNSNAFAYLSTHNCQNSIKVIEGYVNKYNGTTSLIIEEVGEPSKDLLENLNPSDFMEDVYDAKNLLLTIRTLLTSKCSDDAIDVFDWLIESIKDRFMLEYAALSHHDNVKSGLIAHTLKVMRMANLIKMYPNLFNTVSPDLLYLGCAVHDIGKVFEYDNGCISQVGKKLSHRSLGVRFLLENKDMIIGKMGEEFLESLLSVVEQHHGEYEEKPRTLIAYLVHKLDMLDSTLTSLEGAVETAKEDGMVVYEGFKLSF